MKTFKKVLAVALVLAMVIALGATCAFAEDAVSAKASITVTDAKDRETYKAYKIFDATQSGEADLDPYQVSYTIKSDSAWKTIVEGYQYNETTIFTLTASQNDPTVLVVTVDSSFAGDDAAKDFAAYLNNNVGSITPDASATASGTSATLSGLVAGYYFVTTTQGSICALDTNNDEMVITDKTVAPTVTKKVGKSADAYGAGPVDASIGDTIYFKTTVTIPKGTKNLIVHDAAETGFTVTAPVAVANTYTVSSSSLSDSCDFEVVFDQAYLDALTAETTDVEITYTAVLNKDAEISADTNDNVAFVTWGAKPQKSTEVTVSVVTYAFDLVKTDEQKNVLPGAKFRMYTAATEGSEIAVINDSGVYRKAVTGETGVEIEAGEAAFKGFANGTYWFEETAAPAGYNPLTERVSITISDANNNAEVEGGVYSEGGLQVENKTGTELPETGGVGTTMFLLFGAVAFGATALLLVTKKRMYNQG